MAGARRAQGVLHGDAVRPVLCGTLAKISRRFRRLGPADPARGDLWSVAVARRPAHGDEPRGALADGRRDRRGGPGVLPTGTVPHARDRPGLDRDRRAASRPAQKMNVLVVTPTYNERDNLPVLAAGVLKHDGFRLLV